MDCVPPWRTTSASSGKEGPQVFPRRRPKFPTSDGDNVDRLLARGMNTFSDGDNLNRQVSQRRNSPDRAHNYCSIYPPLPREPVLEAVMFTRCKILVHFL